MNADKLGCGPSTTNPDTRG